MCIIVYTVAVFNPPLWISAASPNTIVRIGAYKTDGLAAPYDMQIFIPINLIQIGFAVIRRVPI